MPITPLFHKSTCYSNISLFDYDKDVKKQWSFRGHLPFFPRQLLYWIAVYTSFFKIKLKRKIKVE